MSMISRASSASAQGGGSRRESLRSSICELRDANEAAEKRANELDQALQMHLLGKLAAEDGEELWMRRLNLAQIGMSTEGSTITASTDVLTQN
jgi:hypothetical protein